MKGEGVCVGRSLLSTRAGVKVWEGIIDLVELYLVMGGGFG